MIGLTALILLVLYILLIGKLTRLIARLVGFDKSPVKAGVLLIVLLLLPFVDEIVGRAQFNYECKKVQGYKVSDTIKDAKTLRYDYAPPPAEHLRTFIPIRKGISRVIDVANGGVVLQYQNLDTPGGWVMRAGLSLGGSFSCNSVHIPKVLEIYGFKYVKDGFFERIAGR